jgi:hypothetical protein
LNAARCDVSAQPVRSAAFVTPAEFHLFAKDDLASALGTTARVRVPFGDTRRLGHQYPEQYWKCIKSGFLKRPPTSIRASQTLRPTHPVNRVVPSRSRIAGWCQR